MNAIVDNRNVVLALSTSSSIDSDMVSVKPLFDNLFIDERILIKYCDDFTADSGYRNFINTKFLTEKGLNTIIGFNKKKSINNNINVTDATEDEVDIYKSRGHSENNFGIMQRYPCLINNYQKKIESYEGLWIFASCIFLCNKINKDIRYKNDKNLKKEVAEKNKRERERQLKRKEDNKLAKAARVLERKMESDKRIEETKKIKDDIKKIISKLFDEKITKKIYDKKVKIISDKQGELGTKNIPKYSSFDVFNVNICDDLFENLINNYITRICSYNFADKKCLIQISKKNCYTEKEIKNTLKNFNWEEKIEEHSDIYFEKCMKKLEKLILKKKNEDEEKIKNNNKNDVKNKKIKIKNI